MVKTVDFAGAGAALCAITSFTVGNPALEPKTEDERMTAGMKKATIRPKGQVAHLLT